MELSDLKPNPKNPRKITDKKLKALKKALEEFGDLGGIVYNRRTDQTIGGHQRLHVFKSARDCSITDWNEQTQSGFIEVLGHRFSYREVDWPEEKEMAANIAANKGAGEWDNDGLTEMLHDLDAMNFDLDLTMFDKDELDKLMGGAVDEIGAPNLPTTDKSEFVQMTFTLHESQADEIKRAMEMANGLGPYADLNENKNGNALSRVAERFIATHG